MARTYRTTAVKFWINLPSTALARWGRRYQTNVGNKTTDFVRRRQVPDGKAWRTGCRKGCDWCEGNHFHSTMKAIAKTIPDELAEYPLSERIRRGTRRGAVRSGGC